MKKSIFLTIGSIAVVGAISYVVYRVINTSKQVNADIETTTADDSKATHSQSTNNNVDQIKLNTFDTIKTRHQQIAPVVNEALSNILDDATPDDIESNNRKELDELDNELDIILEQR